MDSSLVITSDDFNALTQNPRILSITITTFFPDDTVSSIIEGELIDGSYDINSDSVIRRTCSLRFRANTELLPNINSTFWINRKFNIKIGISILNTGKISEFNIGYYIINDPSTSLSISDNIVSVKGIDKMALYNGDVSGAILPKHLTDVIIQPTDTSTKTPPENKSYVHNAIKATMVMAMKNVEHISSPEKLIDIRLLGDTVYTDSEQKKKEEQLRWQIIPYKIDKKAGDTYYSIIKELMEMDFNAQCYFDLNGRFVFSRKPNTIRDVSNKNKAWDFNVINLIQSVEREIKYSNVKNNYLVYGGVKSKGDTAKKELFGIQVSYNLSLNNYPGGYSSPYTQERLEEAFTRDLIVKENSYVGSPDAYDLAKKLGQIDYQIDSLTLKDFDGSYKDAGQYGTAKKKEDLLKSLKYAKQKCKDRAYQEVFYHSQATETLKITCVPIYSLDVNQIIFIDDDKTGANGYFVIKEISCGLAPNSLMNITAIKIFNQ